MAQAPTKAIGIMKYELRRNLASELDRALELELSLLNEPVEDAAEGRASFAEGRLPAYTGR
jgi:enoyl-CoA hydratase/carnithine racemase